jgi:hypothetical protein
MYFLIVAATFLNWGSRERDAQLMAVDLGLEDGPSDAAAAERRARFGLW